MSGYNSNGVLIEAVKISEKEERVFALKLSPDGKYIASVLGDGALVLQDANNLAVLQVGVAIKGFEDTPCTAVKWFAEVVDGNYRLATVSTGGAVFLWSWDGTTLGRGAKVIEENNETMCLSISKDDGSFLTAGSDRCVRLYRPDGTLEALLQNGVNSNGLTRPAHTNRIFSVCIVTRTIAVSGGWGGPIQVWDLRSNDSRLEVRGAQVCSDSIEPIPDTTCIIVASHRGANQLQVYDCVSGDELEDDSARLSREMKDFIPLVTRFCKQSGRLWTITSTPVKLLVTSFTSGDIIASLDSPLGLIDLDLSESHPGKAFICCEDGRIIVATLTT
ncbi:hypothetical protein TRVL_00763 [Trypanosoma vivax]|nr:hypothetical protein TRVL_00763 [Trypanosoma vivax]